MNIFQHLSIDFANGWWFSMSFVVINGLMIIIFPKHFKLRVLKQPEYDSKLQRMSSSISFILFQITIWYSIFVPIKNETTSFYIGIGLFIIGIVGYTIALINYATTAPNTPVTKGIYQFSRNPQQIMSIILWLGVGLMLQSYLVITCAVLQLPLSYPGFLAQEQTCIRKYGQPYIEYIKTTRRYL